LPASEGRPNLLVSPFTPCRRPYPGGPSECLRRCLPLVLSRELAPLDDHKPTTPDQVGSVTRLQRLLHATPGVLLALLRPGRLRPSFSGRVAPKPKSVMTGWFHHHLPSPDFTGWTGSIMGCELISLITLMNTRETVAPFSPPLFARFATIRVNLPISSDCHLCTASGNSWRQFSRPRARAVAWSPPLRQAANVFAPLS